MHILPVYLTEIDIPSDMDNIIRNSISRIFTLLPVLLVVSLQKSPNISGKTGIASSTTIEIMGITTFVVSIVSIMWL